MSSPAKWGEVRRGETAATAARIAGSSRTMLALVEGRPEFVRLAFLLDRARSEAQRLLHLHGGASPPVAGSPGEPNGHEPHDREGSSKT